MLYLAFKTLHIVAVILWVGGLFIVTFITAQVQMKGEPLQRAIRVTDAAIGVTWLAGIVLVFLGGWYATKWFYIKVVLVVLISAIHTFTHRRWKSGSDGVSSTVLPYFVLFLSLIVVLLVVFKWPA